MLKNFNKNEALYLTKPIGYLFLFAMFIFLSLSLGLRQITKLSASIDELKTEENLLNQKIFVLGKVSEVVSDNTTFLDLAIPSKAPTLYGLSQIKNQAVRNNLLVSGVRTGSSVPLENGILSSSISFDVEGSKADLYNFIWSFKMSMPIMNVDKIKISSLVPVARAYVTLNVFSSDLPKTIPSVSSSVQNFTAEEVGLIQELANYTKPVFLEPKSTEVVPKSDPFN